MSYYDSVKIIINVILILIFIIVVVWFLSEIKVNKLNNRLNKYSISKTHNRHSLFDIIVNVFNTFRKTVSKIFYKSSYLKGYSKKYEKYIDKKKKNSIQDPMDYVSIKFCFSLLFLLLLLVSTVIQNGRITFDKIIIGFTLGFFSFDIFLLGKKKIVEVEIKNDLLKAITIMNNCFKSGRSILQTIEIVSHELDGPLKKEFVHMYEDLSYGLELEVVFRRFNERVNLKEIKYITTSLTILNKTGGNIVDVFSSIEKTVFSNKKLDDELRNLSASSKALYRLLCIIPFVFTIVIYVLDPTYFMPLFTSTLGIIIMILIIVIYVLYVILIKRIIKIKEY